MLIFLHRKGSKNFDTMFFFKIFLVNQSNPNAYKCHVVYQWQCALPGGDGLGEGGELLGDGRQGDGGD